MIKLYFAAIYLILFNCCFGQNVELMGEIEDSETNLPLPFATIEILSLKTGTIADKNGGFSMEIVSKDSNIDTIEFSYVGYENKKICLADFLESEKTVVLKEKPVVLEEVKIIPKNYSTKIVGVKDKKPWRVQYTSGFGANKGNFLENKKKETGRIKSVSYYLHKDGYPNCPFRVRIYRVEKNHKPGKDLLNENLVVTAQKSGWFKINISSYNIPFPIEGAFVMMEWINSGEEFYFDKEITVTGKNGQPEAAMRKYYGQTLAIVLKKGGVTMWGNNLGNEWIPYDFSHKGSNVNAMINAEIVYENN